MTPAFDRLLSPVRVGPIELRNRIVMGAMHTRLEESDHAAARMAEFYRQRAAGGVALIITGGHSPTPEGRIDEHSPVLSAGSALDTHRAVCDAVHGEGARIVLQILHAGRYARLPDIVAPSPIAAPINPVVPRELSTVSVWATIDAFVLTARAAIDAGYDGVEIMGSEGYLVNQFLAPRTNHRSDEFGGDLDGRMRFALETVQRVRQALGAARLLIYRISALELVEGGMSPAEIAVLARAVEDAGADALDVGIGWHESLVPTVAATVPRAMWRDAARGLKDVVSIPVIAANRINTPAVAERLIADGDADLVSLARPLLADPRFAHKARLGLADEITPCIACNQACLDRVLDGRAATCLVNPIAGHEIEFVSAPGSARRVCVVGAGPAGLACAITAAERGHGVTLLEAADEIGGQLTMAARIPGKAEFLELLRYFSSRLASLGVDVRLGVRATAEEVSSLGCDEVVIATGVVPRVPDIDGVNHPSVQSYVDVLRGRATLGPRVALIGAGGIGFDVAEFLVADPAESLDRERFLAAWSPERHLEGPRARRQVTLLQRSTSRMGSTLGSSTGWIHKRALARGGVQMLNGVAYVRIDDEGLHIAREGVTSLVPADSIVICAGQESERGLADELAAGGLAVQLIGGARLAGEVDCARAIREGTELAWDL